MPIEDTLLVAVFEPQTGSDPKSRLLTDMIAASDDTYLRVVAQVVDNNIAEMEGTALTLQDFLQHRATVNIREQATENLGQTNAECVTDKNKLIVRMALIDGAV